MKDPKPQPNHRRFTKQLALAGLRQRFPALSEPEVKRKYLEVLTRRHNENC